MQLDVCPSSLWAPQAKKCDTLNYLVLCSIIREQCHSRQYRQPWPSQWGAVTLDSTLNSPVTPMIKSWAQWPTLTQQWFLDSACIASVFPLCVFGLNVLCHSKSVASCSPYACWVRPLFVFVSGEKETLQMLSGNPIWRFDWLHVQQQLDSHCALGLQR